MKRIIILPAIRPNAGIGYRYYLELLSITKALTADLRQVVIDAFSTTDNVDIVDGIVKVRTGQWQSYVDRKASVIASQFVSNVDRENIIALAHSFRKAPRPVAESLVVKLNQHGQRALNANKAAVIENVSLIKSIPAKYQEQITFYVTEAMSQGRNKTWLTERIMELGHSTRDRAKLIARDQLNKVTEVINVSRQMGLGITHNKWHHSSRPAQPRKSHVEADGKIYPLNDGLLIDGEKIFPGQKINCYCYSSPVIIFDDGVTE